MLESDYLDDCYADSNNYNDDDNNYRHVKYDY